ncbi:DUF2927 domain-containing protein [Psychromarinibacter sp. C21-152]|uniref:DUF2927 domain-containing protein n=1 Tax=Psychromarinibacter sediminicola TaxID=3033385 RepID=A0AAE3TA02_9RHOB|nr:DUF2927 domain-containing protein [Psychromarinibacter sediminicola]MDF0603185.1 DUF2927 domain-containing protein [Psychromarinibacter sediminicola]
MAWRQGIAAGLAGLTALSACDDTVRTSPPPAARPAGLAAPEIVEPSAESRELSAYYARVQSDLTAQGLLRVDGGGPDTPFTERQLVDNFIRIALYEEFTNIGGALVAQQTESRLHRWNEPIRMAVRFGESVPEDQREADRAEIASYAARLARLTGLRITLTERGGANFHVFVVNEDERRRIGPQLRAIVPDISQGAINTVQNMRRSTFCLVFARDPDDNGSYTQAVAVIRGEHPDLLRRSCIHEELAQGLGLSNDSPMARPSVFNDDEEFGLLTTHDELLLKMLYDPRMRSGMTIREARPVAEEIAAELLGGES